MSSVRSIDPHDPYVVDTRPLGRSAGSMRTLTRTVPALPDLQVGLIAVPQGSDIGLEIRLEAVMEGVLVSGTATTEYVGECARCLDPIRAAFTAEYTELFGYPDDDDWGHRQGDEESQKISHLVGDLCDLTDIVRDATVLALPVIATCRPDCPGLCAECGAKRADSPDHRHDDEGDPRWSSLRQWGEAGT